MRSPLDRQPNVDSARGVPRVEPFSIMRAAGLRLRRAYLRTTLTLPAGPPPQKNRSRPSDSSPEMPVPLGI